jgi:hypothetical protein
MAIFDTLVDSFGGPMVSAFKWGMKLLGPMLILAFYALIGIHIYSFFNCSMYIMKARVGTKLGMIWAAIGLSLLYNLFFNHFMAYMIKPGGPKDLHRIEEKRKLEKKREGKREVVPDNLSEAEKIALGEDKFKNTSS